MSANSGSSKEELITSIVEDIWFVLKNYNLNPFFRIYVARSVKEFYIPSLPHDSTELVWMILVLPSDSTILPREGIPCHTMHRKDEKFEVLEAITPFKEYVRYRDIQKTLINDGMYSSLGAGGLTVQANIDAAKNTMNSTTKFFIRGMDQNHALEANSNIAPGQDFMVAVDDFIWEHLSPMESEVNRGQLQGVEDWVEQL